MNVRVGLGFDAHRLCEGGPLVLGGVRIPWEKGLEGHSDADVVVHAICDALLGAAGAGDLGQHFPDTDPDYAGISSLTLLREVKDIVFDRGFQPLNVDATVVLQEPKIKEYIPEMVANVAEALSLEPSMVNIKATTTEGLGFTGKGEGVAAYATASINAAPPGGSA
jgi:2-C-methyl-D-erythritol 2,4-cyclodiphosphate synthase